LRRRRDPIGHGAVLLVAPLPLYLTTEAAGGSGILAVVLAGLMASHATYGDTAYQGRLEVTTIWRQITLLLQAMAFFLLGLELPASLLELPPPQRATLWWAVPVIVVGLITVRMAAVWGAFSLGRLVGLGSPAGWRGATVVGWSGARGPVSALAAFSLPLVAANGAPLPYRETVVAAALLAVTLTLVLSTTLVPVARLLRIQAPGTEAVQRRLRLAMAEAALAAMESATDDAELCGDPFPEELIAAVRAAADHRVDASKRRRAAGRDHERLRALQMEMLEAEQQELARLRSEESLPDATVRPLLAELDRRIVLVRSAGGV